MMASDDTASKKDGAPKTESATKTESGAKTESKAGEGAAKEAPAAASSADAPANYSRGEGQKPISKAYKNNWGKIFGKKSKKR